ncbi:bacteriocin [Chryseobacterium angstadtii]|uniref:bacteriocin n=1 Tax=Chryseobacterium angstadtii TaxID=558151 RepID=UPI000AC95192|nr:bacteriocin [Chryseobacterium angstadtii]
MKLESLKSKKFEELSDNEMNKVRGGEVTRTGGGYIYLYGKTQSYSEDRFVVLRDGTYGDMAYNVGGIWEII